LRVRSQEFGMTQMRVVEVRQWKTFK
jgi:hypothetical protein